jgi:hypothetical protein
MLHIQYPLEKLGAQIVDGGRAVEVEGERLGLSALAEKLFGDAPLPDRDAWRAIFYWVEECSVQNSLS